MKKKHESKHHLRGYIYAALASSLYAMISVLGKLILHEGTDPMVLILYQYIIASLVLTVGIALFNRSLFKVTKVQLLQMAVQGIIGALGTNICFYMALKYMNAGLVSMLLFTNPIFVTLFFAMTGLKKLKTVNYIALAMAMVGSVLVLNLIGVGMEHLPAIGIVLGLLSALAYAFYNIYADMRLVVLNPFTVSFYTTIFGLVASFFLVLGLFGQVPSVSQQSLIYIAEIAVVAGIMPVVFFYKSVAIIGSERTSIVATMELPMTLVAAYFILGELMNALQLIGVLLILGATVFLHYGEKAQSAAEAQDI